MKRYYIIFHGKRKGAVGAFQQFSTAITADNEKEALSKLREEFEHIYFPRIIELPEEPDVRSTSES